MTFRAKPVVKRAQKPSWESRDRKNFYLNIGFGLVVVAAVLILAIAVGLAYYNDHLVAVGSVAGKSISKDELRDRALIEQWRLDEADRRIATQKAAGHLTEAQATEQSQLVAAQREQVVPIALERIIDTRIQADLATTEGITVADSDIDARLLEEATTPETRHGWVIEVAPELSDGAAEPTAAQVAAARTKIDTALQRPAGRQDLGRDRQDRLHRRLDRAPGRGPRLDRKEGWPGGRGLRHGPLRGGAQHPDGRHRRRGRRLPHRPGVRRSPPNP